MNYSIIIPAHNEEHYLPKCLDSIKAAAALEKTEYEMIVVLNRCTDGTQKLAESHGARIVVENAKNLSKIRNQGVKAAKYEVVITIDADSVMSEKLFQEVRCRLESNRFIGGGVRIKMDRTSLGIKVTQVLVKIILKLLGVSGGLYWCYKSDFIKQAAGCNFGYRSAEERSCGSQ